MWLTSKSPAAVRTAVCSLLMPEYSTGMLKPPNGISLAPILLWMSNKAVRFSATRLLHGNVQKDLALRSFRAKAPLFARLNGVRLLPAIPGSSPLRFGQHLGVEVAQFRCAAPGVCHSDLIRWSSCRK